jgi:hypothetical protein
MATRFERFLCWGGFTAVMLALGALVRWAVPPAITGADQVLGAPVVTAALLLVWCAAAFVGYRPLVRAALARRRGRISER